MNHLVEEVTVTIGGYTDRVSDMWLAFCASELNDLYALDILLRKGINTNDTKSAFEMCAKSGNIEVVEYLVEHGIDIRSDDDRALIVACEYRRFDIVKYLILKGADPNKTRNYPQVYCEVKKLINNIIKIQRACHNWLKRLRESRDSCRLPVWHLYIKMVPWV